MIGDREEEAARPSDLGHTRHGSDLDGTGPVRRSGWFGRIPCLAYHRTGRSLTRIFQRTEHW